jgi:hypothetical protein
MVFPSILARIKKADTFAVLGSAAAVRSPFALLQWEQAKHKLSLVV